MNSTPVCIYLMYCFRNRTHYVYLCLYLIYCLWIVPVHRLYISQILSTDPTPNVFHIQCINTTHPVCVCLSGGTSYVRSRNRTHCWDFTFSDARGEKRKHERLHEKKKNSDLWHSCWETRLFERKEWEKSVPYTSRCPRGKIPFWHCDHTFSFKKTSLLFSFFKMYFVSDYPKLTAQNPYAHPLRSRTTAGQHRAAQLEQVPPGDERIASQSCASDSDKRTSLQLCLCSLFTEPV